VAYIFGATDSVIRGHGGTSESHVGHLVDWGERLSVRFFVGLTVAVAVAVE
jgi:hypothetical protein